MTGAPYAGYVAELEALRLAQGEEASAADQLLTLRDFAGTARNATCLELGTDRGQATKVILNALHGTDGLLVSVDVEDCRDAGRGDNWRFVQTDSADVEAVLTAAPRLRDGIDLVYVDSLHTVDHVWAELTGYFPFVRPGGRILFDDVDPTPYMAGRRKDSVRKEIANRAIGQLVRDVFYDNLDKLRMEVKYGATGLAILTKTAPLGATLAPYRPLVAARTDRALGEFHDRQRGHREYKNARAAESMLIPIPKDDA